MKDVLDITAAIRPIPGHPGYFLTINGDILFQRNRGPLKVRKYQKTNLGYPILSIWDREEKRLRTYLLGRMMMRVFGPPCPGDDYVVTYKDGNKENFAYDNLQWKKFSKISKRTSGKKVRAKIDGKYVEYPSQNKAAQDLGLYQAQIGRAQRGYNLPKNNVKIMPELDLLQEERAKILSKYKGDTRKVLNPYDAKRIIEIDKLIKKADK